MQLYDYICIINYIYIYICIHIYIYIHMCESTLSCHTCAAWLWCEDTCDRGHLGPLSLSG